MGWVARLTLEWRFSNQHTKLELLSINSEAIGLLEILNSYNRVHLLVFQLEHGDQEKDGDDEKHHYTKNY